MKTLTITVNFTVLGFAILVLLENGLSIESDYFFLHLMMLVVPVLNILLLFEGRPYLKRFMSFPKNQNPGNLNLKLGPGYLLMKIFALFLNAILIGTYLILDPPGAGYLFIVLRILLITTPILSFFTILISRSDNFVGFRRTVTHTAISLVTLFFVFLFSMIISMDHEVRKNISLAKMQYPGKAEDALISYLYDESRSPHDRGIVAVWTLGMIGSDKALPILKELYKGDPEGTSCAGKHNEVLCQHNIHNAIVAIEHKDSKFRISWEMLNK